MLYTCESLRTNSYSNAINIFVSVDCSIFPCVLCLREIIRFAFCRVQVYDPQTQSLIPQLVSYLKHLKYTQSLFQFHSLDKICLYSIE